MKAIRQILAIARTEFRFGLRRSAPLVTTMLIGLIVGIGILLAQIYMLREWAPNLNDMSPDKVERLTAYGFTVEEYQLLLEDFIGDWSSISGAPLDWIVMSIMTLLFLPIATVSAIPADRKFDVMEILRSTPITGNTYLAGKIVGILAIVLLAGLIPFLLFLAALEVVLFSYLHVGLSVSTLRFYVELSLLDGLPLLACGSIVGVLTGVVFRTRRAALFPGFVAGISTLFLWLFAFKTPPTLFPVTDLAAYYVFQTYHSEALTRMFKMSGSEGFGLLGEKVAAVGFGQVVLMYMLILATLIMIALFARLWFNWKENF